MCRQRGIYRRNRRSKVRELLQEQRWRVALPSEAQWEKAARGSDARRYPWGENIDPDYANYSETGISATSPLGCFPKGKSAFGCLGMAGNVWEWTRSLFGKDWITADFGYPYVFNDGRENEEASDSALRCLRGGAFYFYEWGLRCAYRYRYHPHYRNSGLGFRVALLPHNSDLWTLLLWFFLLFESIYFSIFRLRR